MVKYYVADIAHPLFNYRPVYNSQWSYLSSISANLPADDSGTVTTHQFIPNILIFENNLLLQQCYAVLSEDIYCRITFSAYNSSSIPLNYAFLNKAFDLILVSVDREAQDSQPLLCQQIRDIEASNRRPDAPPTPICIVTTQADRQLQQFILASDSRIVMNPSYKELILVIQTYFPVSIMKTESMIS